LRRAAPTPSGYCRLPQLDVIANALTASSHDQSTPFGTTDYFDINSRIFLMKIPPRLYTDQSIAWQDIAAS
jgi:hypothetical protein